MVFPEKVHLFSQDTAADNLPQKFTFPFSYQPHVLAQWAMEEVKKYLHNQTDFEHPFFQEDKKQTAIGKMFGVLVVQNQLGDIGFLAAFSGKLAQANLHSYFVPPVFDMLTDRSFFLEEEKELNAINAEVLEAENNVTLKKLLLQRQELQLQYAAALDLEKRKLKHNKNERKQSRIQQSALLAPTDFVAFENDLIKQSLRDKHEFLMFKKEWTLKIEQLEKAVATYLLKIEQLKEARKVQSAHLQKKLFESYHFLNARGETKNLLHIFESHIYAQPPAGAGECCAPKLLQYAYLSQLKPLCMAEFWWGSSPKSEVRLHGQTYPSCWGKCEPILSHMLQGLEVDENPLLENKATDKILDIVYEDAYLMVVNKPSGLLSVPGIHIQDSVYQRLLLRYPQATGPLIVHRLDQDTSGLLVLAKTKEIHKKLQSQFIKRKVKKRYVAKLNGKIKQDKGSIGLPLRLDLDDRPRQLVCSTYGKQALTMYEVYATDNHFTWVYFYPITGRTHQLRVHAAHQLGLGCSIVGDDLYGSPSERLCLHAQQLSFQHPVSEEWVTFETEPEF